MIDDIPGLYTAFRAKDARFDGRFFVGISSTGIYCRPVCTARQPKPENCTFFSSAAEAEKAGYRPCLLCRPELAPGMSRIDAMAELAYRAARLLEEDCGDGNSLNRLADRLGCSDRHLRRVFSEHFNVTPVQYLQTCRLLLAKTLLTDTSLPIIQVALTAGFGSVRRFNDAFKSHYKLPPTAFRRRLASSGKAVADITFALSYRPPYLWKELLQFLAGRAIAGVESVANDAYYRTVNIPNSSGSKCFGWLRVAHQKKKNALSLTISESLLPALPHVIARIRHQFDVNCEPNIIFESLAAMNTFRPGSCVLGTRLPGCFDPFEMAVRAVLGQQITVKAAGTLASRLVAAYGSPLQTPIDGLTHTFPTPGQIVAMGDAVQDNLGRLGVTSARSHTIMALARALMRGELNLAPSARPEEEMKKLMALRGIGSWTAQYIAMRAMEWPDSFLETDAGVKKALHPHTSKEMLAMAEAWRPWRSYAVVNLWNTL
ncbi:MAG: helix-turn-helix domain-containing protein [Planctomycetes bacterium]|nr:helix-turn-helix domain-containing protein [Planctomycetota bacterium]